MVMPSATVLGAQGSQVVQLVLPFVAARPQGSQAAPEPPPVPPMHHTLADGAVLYAMAERMVVLERRMREQLRGRGYEVQDLVQEVCMVVLRRHQHAGRYDPSRATPEAYVRMVTRTVLSHLLEKRDQPSALSVEVDAAQVDRAAAQSAGSLDVWARPAGYEVGPRQRRRRRAAYDGEVG